MVDLKVSSLYPYHEVSRRFLDECKKDEQAFCNALLGCDSVDEFVTRELRKCMTAEGLRSLGIEPLSGLSPE